MHVLRVERQEGSISELLLRRQKLGLGNLSKCCHSARSRMPESQNPSAEDSWISEVEKPLLKNQSRGRIQTEVS